MPILKQTCAGIEKTIYVVIPILLMMMTAVIFYQVVLRYVFHSANIWAEEFARYAFVWVVLLGAANATRRFQHITIDFVVDSFPPKVKTAVEILNYVLIAAFLAILIRYGIAITMRTTNQISAGMHIPIAFMYLSIPVSSALMLLFTTEILIEKIRRPARDAGEAEE